MSPRFAHASAAYDSVLFGPVFDSLTKQGYGPAPDFPWDELRAALAAPRAPSRTAVFAVGGVTGDGLERCRDLGFDGAALLGAVWNDSGPGSRVRIHPCKGPAAGGRPPCRLIPPCAFRLMCLTFEGAGMPHAEQVSRLCAAGARWIQLRMKGADKTSWLREARAAGASCRAGGAVFIVNDSVDVALESGADGVHLGSRDEEWASARKRLGPDQIIGGTVNNAADARRAVHSGCLDYVGVGPLRFTSTKAALAPVLGLGGIRALLAELGDLPAWAIGGIEASDLESLRHAGVHGAAVSSALFRNGQIQENLGSFLSAAWPSRAAAQPVSLS